jgi:hypothetical protein
MLEFSKVPQIQALSCMPIVERSDAEIIVDRVTGNVQSYRLVAAVTPDDSAWSESFIIRNLTDPNDPQSRKQMAQDENKGDRIVTQNATSRYEITHGLNASPILVSMINQKMIQLWCTLPKFAPPSIPQGFLASKQLPSLPSWGVRASQRQSFQHPQ